MIRFTFQKNASGCSGEEGWKGKDQSKSLQGQATKSQEQMVEAWMGAGAAGV